MTKLQIIATGAAGVLLILAVVLFSFQPKPEVSTASALQDFISNNGYEPFAIPRNNWGAGTVISFDENGNENIVWRNDECLKLTSASDAAPGSSPHVDQADASLSTSSYRLGSNAAVELTLAKGIDENLDLAAGLQDGRVAGIEISISDPREHTVSDGRLKRRIINLTQGGDNCTDELFITGHYVIDRVLSVDGFSFTFKTASNSTISLDADLMDAMNLASSLRQKFAGVGNLTSTESRMVGYRLFELIIDPGLAAGEIETKRVDPAELKRRARQ